MKKLLFGLVVLFSVALLFGTVPVMAQEVEEEEGQGFLFYIEEAYVEKGEFELSGSVEYMDNKKPEDVATDTWTVNLEAEYGFTDRIKGAIEIPYISYEENGTDENGIGDLELSGAFAILKQTEEWPEISIGLEASAPTGDYKKGLGTDVWGWGPFIRCSKTWERIALHGNLAYGIFNSAKEYEADEDETEEIDETELEFGGAFVYMPTDNVDLILELVGEYETEDNEETEHETEIYIVPGAKYEFDFGLEVGLGVPIGLTDDSYDWGVIAKAQYEF